MELLAVTWFQTLRVALNLGVDKFTNTAYKNIAFVLADILVATLTILVMLDGYQIIAGVSSRSAGAFVLKWLKIVVLTTIATATAVENDGVQYAVLSISKIVTTLITNTELDVFTIINASLTAASGISSLSTIVTSGLGNDHEISKLVTVISASVGSTTPILTALATSYVLELTIKIGIMVAPIFLFAGIFERTAEWPLTWAKYLLGSVITSSIMAIMAGLSIGVMVSQTAAAFIAYKTGTSLIFISILSLVNGLFMSVLLISVPSIAMKIMGMAADGAASNQLGGGSPKTKGAPRGYGNRNMLGEKKAP